LPGLILEFFGKANLTMDTTLAIRNGRVA
jgi:hypothetical protein